MTPPNKLKRKASPKMAAVAPKSTKQAKTTKSAAEDANDSESDNTIATPTSSLPTTSAYIKPIRRPSYIITGVPTPPPTQAEIDEGLAILRAYRAKRKEKEDKKIAAWDRKARIAKAQAQLDEDRRLGRYHWAPKEPVSNDTAPKDEEGAKETKGSEVASSMVAPKKEVA
ncbi:hypothetical protein BJ508DRAFT_331438 [Ascobolus immersus RN42]|uniref:Uncharacterized protein n=1 Tax=Ascobolus immersus RN42 TaxID=1160509 RepID=A0A3N4HVZ0_ASCIM|nr:hypothetical protein BJ508DRAFT_331438 [Ascobolus immersus RN42]